MVAGRSSMFAMSSRSRRTVQGGPGGLSYCIYRGHTDGLNLETRISCTYGTSMGSEGIGGCSGWRGDGMGERAPSGPDGIAGEVGP